MPASLSAVAELSSEFPLTLLIAPRGYVEVTAARSPTGGLYIIADLYLSAHLSASQPELGQANQVSEQDASDGSHSPAAVGQLSLTEPLQGLGVGAQAQGVEAAASIFSFCQSSPRPIATSSKQI